ncbi:hypothetical protein SHELI_v1c04050 [Spiroplasma helicoides]|uniref:Lipoprotein n=1 Tax=Spiroplasma helicoides TaxID=216938 RepID=A0A1B3SKA1_9MOLU|nr:hypothetical protein [Spiroplasma helicoides]AOG60356.1 hypothetical protein SHELI_v1c04050 [Spiroplasma helicoides]
MKKLLNFLLAINFTALTTITVISCKFDQPSYDDNIYDLSNFNGPNGEEATYYPKVVDENYIKKLIINNINTHTVSEVKENEDFIFQNYQQVTKEKKGSVEVVATSNSKYLKGSGKCIISNEQLTGIFLNDIKQKTLYPKNNSFFEAVKEARKEVFFYTGAKKFLYGFGADLNDNEIDYNEGAFIAPTKQKMGTLKISAKKDDLEEIYVGEFTFDLKYNDKDDEKVNLSTAENWYGKYLQLFHNNKKLEEFEDITVRKLEKLFELEKMSLKKDVDYEYKFSGEIGDSGGVVEILAKENSKLIRGRALILVDKYDPRIDLPIIHINTTPNKSTFKDIKDAYRKYDRAVLDWDYELDEESFYPGDPFGDYGSVDIIASEYSYLFKPTGRNKVDFETPLPRASFDINEQGKLKNPLPRVDINNYDTLTYDMRIINGNNENTLDYRIVDYNNSIKYIENFKIEQDNQDKNLFHISYRASSIANKPGIVKIIFNYHHGFITIEEQIEAYDEDQF